MNQITINVDSSNHPMKVVLQENGETVLSMPSDELLSCVKRWIRHEKTCRGREGIIEEVRRLKASPGVNFIGEGGAGGT